MYTIVHVYNNSDHFDLSYNFLVLKVAMHTRSMLVNPTTEGL